MTRVLSVAVVLLLFAFGSRASAATCAELGSLILSGGRVTGIERVPAGRFSPSDTRERPGRAQTFSTLPAFCRVMVTARPSADSDIRIEVWLPESGWNGRLQAVGDGGLAGSIPFAAMAPALAEGYVAAGTDTGHVGGTADFMPDHPEKLVDFAYRSTHELALAAKAVTTAFYGTAPSWSYYAACSGGGRHALTSAQRYPADFDGIVAGAPTWNQARLDAARIGINLVVNRDAESRIPPAKYPMIHAAVLAACDDDDGVHDGIIGDPPACAFDYASLTCTGADGPDCLTTAQVDSAKVMTSAFRDPATGRVLLEPHLWPGAELQWSTLGGPAPLANSLARVRRFHLKDPAWVFRLENVGADVERAARMDGGLLASDRFDLGPFFDRGGKLLMWHGWSDQQVPAENSAVYYRNVLEAVGPRARRSIVLFMLPGVLHCGGGPGADEFDPMGAITSWVEQGSAPVVLTASKREGAQTVLTRPLCPYPSVARYAGTGDSRDARSFRCTTSQAGDGR